MHIKQHPLNEQDKHVADGDQHQVQGVLSNKVVQSSLGLGAMREQVHQPRGEEYATREAIEQRKPPSTAGRQRSRQL
jgi:hypothetical protein